MCTGTAIVGGIITGGILVRAALASPLVAGVGGAGVPIVASAQDKLAALKGQFGVASSNIVQMAMNGARYFDNANGSNINALLSRRDGVAGFIRVTFGPNFQRVISAGLIRANQVTNAIASGRFTPY